MRSNHLWFLRIGFALSLGLLFLTTGCAIPATSTTPSASSPSAPSAPSAPSSVSVAINPLYATIREGGSLPFLVTVKGVADTTVTWSVQGSATGASITSSGVFTAPNALGYYTVVATSVADATARVVAEVSIEPPVTSTPVGDFTAVGNMTVPRVGSGAVLLPDGRVLIMGGEESGPTAEFYNPATRTFQASNANVVWGFNMLLNNGELLVLGTGTAQLYDPRTDSATPTGHLLVDQEIVTANLLANGKVLVLGTHDTEVYDPASGTFAVAGPSADPGLVALTVTWLTNGKVLFTGCTAPQENCSVPVAKLFDPQDGTFSLTGPMKLSYYPDYGYTSILLTDGRVLFLGSNDWPEPADVEVYDPGAGTFTSFAGPASQEFAPALVLADGTVLIAGGQLPGGSGDTTAELYVPASGTFEFAGAMTTGRFSETLTPLPDGTVLITGGFGVAWPRPTSSAEIYRSR